MLDRTQPIILPLIISQADTNITYKLRELNRFLGLFFKRNILAKFLPFLLSPSYQLLFVFTTFSYKIGIQHRLPGMNILDPQGLGQLRNGVERSHNLRGSRQTESFEVCLRDGRAWGDLLDWALY